MSREGAFLEKSKGQEKPKPIRRYLGRLATVGLVLLGPLDLAASDAAAARLYGALEQHVHVLDNKVANQLTIDGLELSALTAEAAALGMAIAKSRRVRNISEDYDDYLDKKRAKMGILRRGISHVFNSPFKAFEVVGSGFRKAGEFVGQKKSGIAKEIGATLIEAGRNNSYGTTNVVLQDTMAGNPPKLWDTVRYGLEVGVPYVAGAEAVKGLDKVPGLRLALGEIGRGLLDATSINIHSLNSGDIVLSGLAVTLAVSGWNIEKYRENRQALDSIAQEVPLSDQQKSPAS